MMTKLQVDKDNRFEICFMVFDACIFDFHECCRPTIAIDRTHLNEKYKGILFIAISMDGNDQIFLIAFGVGHLENDRCWTWFLTKLRNVIGYPRDMIIISNRYKHQECSCISVFRCCTWSLRFLYEE